MQHLLVALRDSFVRHHDVDFDIRDFPGNYSQYREIAREEQKGQSMSEQPPVIVEEVAETITQAKPAAPAKLSFKEKRELEELNKAIPALEAEKATLEEAMSHTGIDFQDLQKMGDRISAIIQELDEKEMRWLELSER